ncbi:MULTISPECIES: ATP-binding protein [Streptomyces]|uniref:ATP-binding protein n=1 Tax=Streptomyces TaxID=1883 RepID=UPI002248ED54|nr:ATP-binding protein [Streptomyces sp. JHD 1]MCX2969301.1 ATP-binding protein [Streptomyces sp. JHD 1]
MNASADQPRQTPVHPAQSAHDSESAEIYGYLVLRAERAAVACARGFTKSALTAWKLDQLVDDASLIVSELVTNAVSATDGVPRVTESPGVLRLGLHHSPSSVVIGVWDVSAAAPVVRSVDPTAVGGRGLRLVEALASRWGYSWAIGGKAVWAELATVEASVLTEDTSRARPPLPSPDADSALLRRLLRGLNEW